MKIAMIGQKGIPARAGGIERHVEELSAELSAQGHEVLVFCRPSYGWPADGYRGVRTVMVRSIPSKHLDAITHTFLSILRAAREGVDIFHFHGVGPSLLAWIPRLIAPRAKVVATFHCIDRHHGKWNRFARMMLRIGEWCACRAPHATVAVSKVLQTYCRLTYDREAVYIPNGAAVAEDPAEETRVRALGLEPGKYFMMCARLIPHKGAHRLIDAWKELRAREPESTEGFKLAIVGGGAFTDAYVREVRRLAEEDPSVVLTGVQTGKNLHALYAHSYAAVHPSESEGLPIAVLEAMAYGKAVLASDIPECKELIEGSGYAFRLDDGEDLVRHLAWMLANPAELAVTGRRAREFVARNYDWRDIALTTGYLYEFLSFNPELQEQESKTSA